MKDNICNLKNLYRIITEKDYPVYSTGVIPQELKKGLTLQKFWQELLLPDFTKQGKYGTMIFRTEGSRNRYFSQFCNRDSSITFYAAHAMEIDEILSEDLLKRQAEIFVTFLKKRECNSHELLKKLEASNGAFYNEDSVYDSTMRSVLDTLFLQNNYFIKVGGDTLRNHVAYVFSFLVLFSLYGTPIREEDRIEKLQAISENYENEIKGLFRTERSEVDIVSNKRSILWCTPLERSRFFGREREMFDILECIRENGHCLVSGIGGIGKTELLRQVLHTVEENHLVDEIVTVQWENSIQESFSKAMPFIQGESQNEKFNNIVAGFRRHEEKRRLILIDNVEADILKDEHLEVINSLEDAVIISSRMTRIKGFETYVIDQLSPESCTLVFRSAYEKRITKADMDLLNTFLENRFLRHTLTIGMVGRYMNRHDISIKELETFESRFKTRNLQGVYKKMYAMTDISESEADIMVFLSRMPNIKYDIDFFLKNYPDAKNEESVIADMERLCNFGWLIYDGASVSVHPFIAECVLSMNPQSDIIEKFLKRIRDEWAAGRDIGDDYFEISLEKQRASDEEDVVISQMITSCLEKGKEAVSGDNFALYSIAIDCITTRTGAGSWRIIAEKMKSIEVRTEEYSDPVKAGFLCAINRQADGEQFKKDLKKLKDRINIEQYCNCCLYMMCILLEHGKYEEGVKYGEYVVANTKDNDFIANAYSILMSLYISLEKYDKAQQIFEKAGKISSSLRQHNDLEITMASLYTHFGMLDEAEKLYEHVGETIDKTGQDLKTKWIASYATCKRIMGKYEEAEELFKDTMNNVDYLFGSDNFIYISHKLEYCIVLSKLKKFDLAEKYYQECLDILKKSGYEAEHYYRSCNNFAVMYLESNRPKKALEWLDSVLEPSKAIGGIHYTEVLNNHARALDGLGERRQALLESKEAYEGLKAVYGPNHQKTMDCAERIARLSGCEQKK